MQRGNHVWDTNDPGESPDATTPSFNSKQTRTEDMIQDGNDDQVLKLLGMRVSKTLPGNMPRLTWELAEANLEWVMGKEIKYQLLKA